MGLVGSVFSCNVFVTRRGFVVREDERFSLSDSLVNPSSEERPRGANYGVTLQVQQEE